MDKTVKGYVVVVPTRGTSMFKYFYAYLTGPINPVAGLNVCWEKTGSRWLGLTEDKTHACRYEDNDQARKSASYLNEILDREDSTCHPGCFVTEYYE